MNFHDAPPLANTIFSKALRNPQLMLPPLVAFLLLSFFSQSSYVLAPLLTTTLANILWLTLYLFLTLALLSYCFSTLILLADAALTASAQQRHRARALKLPSLRTAWRAFLITFILMAADRILLHPQYGLAALLTKFLVPSDMQLASLVFILLGFTGLVTGIIFLTLATPIAVLSHASVFASIAASARFVRAHYLAVLSLLILFYIPFSLSNHFLPEPLNELFKLLVLLPLLTLVLVALYRTRAARETTRA